MSSPELVENFFRHEYGKLVSLLSGRTGATCISDVEDAVQSALESALVTWTRGSAPDNPSAWLYTVARNKLIEGIRTQANRSKLLFESGAPQTANTTPFPETFLPGEISDELLRMLYKCCDDSLPTESQLAIALKILCGFNVKEIALALFTSDTNVYKRIGRARKALQATPFLNRELTAKCYVERRPSVLKLLYLMFNEGFHSTSPEETIREDLCREAIRLAELIVESPAGDSPEVFALLALFNLLIARIKSRTNALGGVVLMEDQDRSQWDKEMIRIGLHWLTRSAQGTKFTQYHAEAGVAAEHAIAPSFQETRWDRIVSCYELLESVSPSPIHTLNKAIAISEWKDPQEGLRLLEEAIFPTWLTGAYLWTTTLGYLRAKSGQFESAQQNYRSALSTAPNESIRGLIRQRFKSFPEVTS